MSSPRPAPEPEPTPPPGPAPVLYAGKQFPAETTEAVGRLTERFEADLKDRTVRMVGAVYIIDPAHVYAAHAQIVPLSRSAELKRVLGSAVFGAALSAIVSFVSVLATADGPAPAWVLVGLGVSILAGFVSLAVTFWGFGR